MSNEQKIKRYLSPGGVEIVGTLETIQATASISGISEDGVPQYAGESKINWDSQKTVLHNGNILFVDEDGERWTFDQLTAEDLVDDVDEQPASPSP